MLYMSFYSFDLWHIIFLFIYTKIEFEYLSKFIMIVFIFIYYIENAKAWKFIRIESQTEIEKRYDRLGWSDNRKKNKNKVKGETW